MFISDSYQQQGGGGTSVSSNNYTLGNDFSIHALRRDADGMLRYTKIRSIDDETGDFFRLDGSSYLDIATGAYDYVEETTEEKSYSNNPQDKYQQYRFDSRKISYFVDDDGYFVIRFNENYDYSTEGPK
jgi:hypothetical protein